MGWGCGGAHRARHVAPITPVLACWGPGGGGGGVGALLLLTLGEFAARFG